MENKRFERVFLLFTREDEIINGGQSPSGYVKLESLDNKIKLSASIQGIRQAANDEFSLLLFSDGTGEVRFFDAGILTFRNSKCDIVRDIILNGSNFDSEPFKNVGGAVLVKVSNGQGAQGFSCPLVAFKNNKRLSYKNGLINFLYSKQEKRQIEQEKETGQTHEKQEEPEERTLREEEPENDADKLYEASVLSTGEASADESNRDNVGSEEGTGLEEPSQGSEEAREEESTIENSNAETHKNTEFEEFQNMLRQFGISELEGGNGICMEPVTQAQKEMCENCNKLRLDDADKGSQINAAKLKLLFNKYFEPYDPFRIRRTDYKWWKVGSPVQLNNLLYQNNIKTPLLFNPQLMMAHFKYKHILTGIYISRRRGKEYIVCGVPAVYNIDEKPYGNFCRWAQLESVRPRHGAFGYWLVYIDIKTGNFLNL